MDRELSITPILVNHQPLPGPTSWVKIFIYEPSETEVLATRGQMYAVLSVSSKVQVDFAPVMQLILEELHSQYFQQPEGGILQTLEAALDDIHKKLLLMAQGDKRLSAGFNFNLLTAVSWGTVLYFGQLGASRAGLLRKGMLYDIDEGDTKSTTLYLSSGILQPHDRVILGTQELFQQVGRNELQTALNSPADQLAKSIEQHLSDQAQRASQSAIVLDIDIKQVPSPEDEALQIADPSHGIATPVVTIRRPSMWWRIKEAGADIRALPGRIWHWHIFGHIPGLPAIIVLLAAGILGTSVWWSLANHQPATQVDVQPLVSQITSQLNQAKELVAVNPDRAQDFITQADQNLQRGLASQPNNSQLRNLQDQRNKLEDQLNAASQLSGVTQVASLSATSLQPKLVIKDHNIYVINKAKSELLKVTDSGKVSTLTANKTLAQALISASDSEMVAVNGAQAHVISDSGSLGSAIGLPPSVQVQALTGFHQTNYVLDKVGQVWRIPENPGNDNPPTTYFGQPIDGANLQDIAVDGSIYLLRQQGNVDVYLNGIKQLFTMERSNLATHTTAIFANDGNDNLYLLDPHALLVWNKTGKYVGQYYLPDRPALQMAGIDFASKTLYILSEGKLFKTALP